MSTEKLVKQQARAALRGNLSQLIAGAGVAAAVFLLWEFIEYFALNELGVQDTENILQSDQWFVVPVVVVFMALVLFSTPLLNGFLRMAASTAVRRCAENVIRSMCFTFSKRRCCFSRPSSSICCSCSW